MTPGNVREVDGLALVVDPYQGATVWFYPTAVRPEIDEAGVAAVTLILTGKGGILSLGSSLSVAQSALDEAEAVARTMVGETQSKVELKSAPLMVHEARLEVVSPVGEQVVLATSTSSGYPPFQAVFSASLDAPAAASAASALRGGKGHLFVTYRLDVTLPRPVGSAPPTPTPSAFTDLSAASSVVPLTLEADVATWFPAGSGSHVLVTPGHDGEKPQPHNPPAV